MDWRHRQTLPNLDEGDEDVFENGDARATAPSAKRSTSLPDATAAPPVTEPSGSSSVRRQILRSAFSTPSVVLQQYDASIPEWNPDTLSPGEAQALTSTRDGYEEYMRRYRPDASHSSWRSENQGLEYLLEEDSDGEINDDEEERVPEEPTKNDIERLEWQSVLSSVLDGDVLKSEKVRIAVLVQKRHNARQEVRRHDFWLALRANLHGVSEANESASVRELREKHVDKALNDIMEFSFIYTGSPTIGGDSKAVENAARQVGHLLPTLDAVESLYPTLKDMATAKPLCVSPDFLARRDTLVSWANLANALYNETQSLQEWTQSKSLNISSGSPRSSRPASPQHVAMVAMSPFIERLLKEESLQRMLEKKTLTSLRDFLQYARSTVLSYGTMFRSLNLPTFEQGLAELILFPPKLLEAVLRVRLQYAEKMEKMIPLTLQQLIEDFLLAVGFACTTRSEHAMHTRVDRKGVWKLSADLPPSYDKTVLRGVRFLFKLIGQKVKTMALDDVNVMETYGAVFDEVSLKLPGGSSVVAAELCILTSKMVGRVAIHCRDQVKLSARATTKSRKLAKRGPKVNVKAKGKQVSEPNRPQVAKRSSSDLSIVFSSALYSDLLTKLRLPTKKLVRFSSRLIRRLCNSAQYSIGKVDETLEILLKRLEQAGYFLVYTDSFEEESLYILAHPKLSQRPNDITKILTKSYHVERFGSSARGSSKAGSAMGSVGSSTEKEDGDIEDGDGDDAPATHLILISPTVQFVWTGAILELAIPSLPVAVGADCLTLVADGSHSRLAHARHTFEELIQWEDLPTHIRCIEDQQSHLSLINTQLYRLSKNMIRLTETIIDTNRSVELALRDSYETRQIITDWFTFASEHGQQAMQYILSSSRPKLNRSLFDLALNWLTYICEHCDTEDQQTLQWASSALEFTRLRTRNSAILCLSEDQFNLLRQAVGSCVALLSSQYDVLGARARKAEGSKKSVERDILELLEYHSDPELMLSMNSGASGRGGARFGSTSMTYEGKTRLSSTEAIQKREDIEQQRALYYAQHSLTGKVIDAEHPEHQSLLDLANAVPHVPMRWQQGRFVGSGAFGSVYQAINLETGAVMAVKEIRYQHMEGSNLVAQIKAELTVMEMLHHPNIVDYYGIEVHRDKVYIFEEYCPGGSLEALLQLGRIEDELIIQAYAFQMLEGLHYMHSNNIVHRDLKPANILLDFAGALKFVDFGAAKVLAKNHMSIQRVREGSKAGPRASLARAIGTDNSLTGTPMYMAPEVIKNERGGQPGAMDIWSLACVLLQCATGDVPWSNLDNEWAVMFHIGIAAHHPPLPTEDQLSAKGVRFLKRCFAINPKLRPTALDLLDDPWILDFKAIMEEEEEVRSLGSSELG